MTGPAVTPNPKADLWDALVKAGLPADSATKSVNAASDAGMSNADAYDHFVFGKAAAPAAPAAPPKSVTNAMELSRAMSMGAIPGLAMAAKQAIMSTPDERTSFGLTAANAALGFQGHRISAALQSLKDKGDLSDYKANDARIRGALDESAQSSPNAAMAGNVAGSVASPLNRLAAPLGLLGGSAALGAVAGSGQAKDDLASQILGTGAGAAGGLLFGGIAKGLSSLGGPSAASKAVGPLLENPTAVASHPLATPADVTPNARLAAMNAAKADPATYDALKGIVEPRHAAQTQRVAQALTDLTGDHPALADMIAGLKAVRKTTNDANFGAIEAKDAPMPVQPLLDKLSEHPAILKVLKKAMLAGDIKSAPQEVQGVLQSAPAVPAKKSIYDLLVEQGVPEAKAALRDPAGAQAATAPPSRKMTFSDVSDFQKELSDLTDATFDKAGKFNLATQYKAARNAVRSYLADHAGGEYTAANAQHSLMKTNEDALQAGIDAGTGKLEPGDIERQAATWAAKTPQAEGLFRNGLSSTLHAKLHASGPDAFLNMEPNGALYERLVGAGGNPAKAQQFLSQMQAEQQLAKLKLPAVRPDAPPTRLGGFKPSGMDVGTGGGVYAMFHNPEYAAAAAVARPVFRGVQGMAAHAARQTQSELGGLLLSGQGPDAIQALLSRMNTPQQTMSLLTQGALAGGAGGAGGSLGGLLAH